MSRDDQIEAFLSQAGWGGAQRTAIAGDASFRRYERVRLDGGAAILMDAPPGKEDVRPFLAVADLLLRWGFSAPRIFAQDPETGLILLEDLGDATLNKLLARDRAAEPQLYELAVDALAALHRHDPPASIAVAGNRHALAPYDEAALLREARLLSDWYLPALHEASGSGLSWRCELDPLWQDLFAALKGPHTVLVLRDYHADNLMWLPARQGVARLGLLDFQDALAGHPAYDLVSLLQDARRDVPPALEEAMITRYLSERTDDGADLDAAAFRRDYAILGAQRAAKIVGIFTRLHRRDGKARYLALIPRVWGLLERNLAAGGFAGLEAALEAAAPTPRRRAILPA